jgi:hypothetical protein
MDPNQLQSFWLPIIFEAGAQMEEIDKQQQWQVNLCKP